MERREPRDVLDFAAALGISLYDWQSRILLAIDKAAMLTRRKFAVRAPNGVGKTERLIALCCLWWLVRFPKGRVVVTSFDSRQIADQLWPALRTQLAKFAGWRASNAEYRIDTPSGGRLRAFTTDDPGRAEGFHADKDCPLLIIVDECKSVPAEIVAAIDRCSYNVLAYISSPGMMQGPFYEAFTSNSERFVKFAIGLKDCPHVSPEKIADIEATYGKEHPFTKSSLHGEFMSHGEGVNHIIELPDIEVWRSSSIGLMPGPTVLACDFACGGDDNVILKRVGNRVTDIVTWKDRNTAAAVGRFVRELRRLGYESGRNVTVVGDATGPGRPMVDLIQESGIEVVQFNFGGHTNDPTYKDEGTRVWYQAAKMIRESQIAAPPRYHPDTAKLRAAF